jgi:hypothetical protein
MTVQEFVRQHRRMVVDRLAGGGDLPQGSDPVENVLVMAQLAAELCNRRGRCNAAVRAVCEMIDAQARRLEGCWPPRRSGYEAGMGGIDA